jgi:hypothetical protein
MCNLIVISQFSTTNPSTFHINEKKRQTLQLNKHMNINASSISTEISVSTYSGWTSSASPPPQ